MKAIYTGIPRVKAWPPKAISWVYRVLGVVLTPLHLIGAWIFGGPGVALHVKCAISALGLVLKRRISVRDAMMLALYPFDTVRYFEFDTLWRWMNSSKAAKRYLDVSSPRLFFVLLLESHQALKACLVNPDARDLATSEAILKAFDLTDRCETFNILISEANFAPGTFDVITSISVIEHIPEPHDLLAIKKIWQLLRPGGRLFVSVPCAAECFEEYVNPDGHGFGILKEGDAGYLYEQRFYDEEMLHSCFFRITGKPVRMSIYGEKHPGTFMKQRDIRCRKALYPFWRESFMMARNFRYFERIQDLPGIGVVAMEFIKPQEQ